MKVITQPKDWRREHPWLAAASGALVGFVILTALRVIAYDQSVEEAIRESWFFVLIAFVVWGVKDRYFPPRAKDHDDWPIEKI